MRRRANRLRSFPEMPGNTPLFPMGYNMALLLSAMLPHTANILEVSLQAFETLRYLMPEKDGGEVKAIHEVGIDSGAIMLSLPEDLVASLEWVECYSVEAPSPAMQLSGSDARPWADAIFSTDMAGTSMAHLSVFLEEAKHRLTKGGFVALLLGVAGAGEKEKRNASWQRVRGEEDPARYHLQSIRNAASFSGMTTHALPSMRVGLGKGYALIVFRPEQT